MGNNLYNSLKGWSHRRLIGKHYKCFCLGCDRQAVLKPIEECKEPKHLEYYNKNLETKRKSWRKLGWRHSTTEQKRIWNRDRYKRRKLDLIIKLGEKCVSCGLTDARCLHLDHIHGGGGKERKEMKSHFLQHYRRMSNEELKSKLQLLCANCHAIKSFRKLYDEGKLPKAIKPKMFPKRQWDKN